jgi:hypothetical protein
MEKRGARYDNVAIYVEGILIARNAMNYRGVTRLWRTW